MATLTGNLKFIDASLAAERIVFVPLSTPAVIGSSVGMGKAVSVVLSAAGDLPDGLILLAGRYTVKLQNKEDFEIEVPDSEASLDIIGLVSDDDPEPASHIRKIYNRTAGEWQEVYLDGTGEARQLRFGASANDSTLGRIRKLYNRDAAAWQGVYLDGLGDARQLRFE